MKYIHVFDTNNEFVSAYTGSDYLEPWVSATKTYDVSSIMAENNTMGWQVTFQYSGTGSTPSGTSYEFSANVGDEEVEIIVVTASTRNPNVGDPVKWVRGGESDPDKQYEVDTDWTILSTERGGEARYRTDYNKFECPDITPIPSHVSVVISEGPEYTSGPFSFYGYRMCYDLEESPEDATPLFVWEYNGVFVVSNAGHPEDTDAQAWWAFAPDLNSDYPCYFRANYQAPTSFDQPE